MLIGSEVKCLLYFLWKFFVEVLCSTANQLVEECKWFQVRFSFFDKKPVMICNVTAWVFKQENSCLLDQNIW